MQSVCQIPRYRDVFELAAARCGKNVARIIVARMLVRSLFKMLKDGEIQSGSRGLRTKDKETTTTCCPKKKKKKKKKKKLLKRRRWFLRHRADRGRRASTDHLGS